jgi:hypothetical protein
MDFALSRLSEGECARTTGPGAITLAGEGAPTLRPDTDAFRQLAAQLAPALAPMQAEPVITSGPSGFDLSLETQVTALQGDVWRRGSRGPGGTTRTCAGENSDPRERLISERLHVSKGLPLGFSIGVSFGKLFATSAYSVGADVKFALLEEALDDWLPDVALRGALHRSVGTHDYDLMTSTLELLLSDRFVIARTVVLSPFLGAGLLHTRVRSETIDLTPNIDAIACRDGRDPVCNGAGLGASGDDLAHDVRFPQLSLWRARGLAGFALRYRWAALTSAVMADLARPRLGDGVRGVRQWSLSVAPSVSF